MKQKSDQLLEYSKQFFFHSHGSAASVKRQFQYPVCRGWPIGLVTAGDEGLYVYIAKYQKWAQGLQACDELGMDYAMDLTKNDLPILKSVQDISSYDRRDDASAYLVGGKSDHDPSSGPCQGMFHWLSGSSVDAGDDFWNECNGWQKFKFLQVRFDKVGFNRGGFVNVAW